MADMQNKMQDISVRLSKERKMVEGFQAMANASSNPDTKRSCEAKIKEGLKNVEWFENSLRELQARASESRMRSSYETDPSMHSRQQQSSRHHGTPTGSTSSPGSDSPYSRQSQDYYQRGTYARSDRPGGSASSSSTALASQAGVPQASYGSNGDRASYYGQSAGSRQTLPQPPPGARHGYQEHPGQPNLYASQSAYEPVNPAYGPEVPEASTADDLRSTRSIYRKPQYSGLDLIKSETPLTGAKIARMLYQLEFKLQTEKAYKQGVDKIAKLYQLEGDKKSRQDADAKRVESEQKILLLQQALRRYQSLNIMADVDDDENQQDARDNLRKPLTGALQISIKYARDLGRAPVASKRSKAKTESVVVVKVEDTPRARTHASKIDKWNEEFEIHVDKANEVEVTVYDSRPGEIPIPIGMLWIRLNDVVEELRRKRVTEDPRWVTANRVETDAAQATSPTAYTDGNDVAALDVPVAGYGANGQQKQGSGSSGSGEGITAWFAVEPEGAILLHLQFVKSNVKKRPLETGGLGRQGAVRKRKEEVHEQNGHKFVQQQFFSVVLCAYCRGFLNNAAGMQCEDCKYVCHRKCFHNVVTKCISKTNAEADKDEDKINHRIPHRFEPISSISPNWCCHCGMVLPLFGRKRGRKCTECDLTCHQDCAHLVPDFCGMSMVMANQLLKSVKQININRTRQSQYPSDLQSTLPRRPARDQVNDLDGGMGRLQLTGDDGHRQHQRQESQETLASGRKPILPPIAVSSARHSLASPPPSPTKPLGPREQGYVPTPPARESSGSLGSIIGSYADDPPALRAGTQPRLSLQTELPTIQSQPQRTSATTPLPAHQASPAPSVTALKQRKRKVGLDDFNFLAVLGKGNFGKVMLAEEKHTNQLYAIKVLKKDFIIENDEVESTKSEKRVFLAAGRQRHPFLLGLHSCFQTETRLYFCMPYVSGGDLMLHIQREQFSPRRAKFYACEVLMALEYFHSQGIVYRDLKLDNILLTLDGHVVVADYGLCKEEMWYGATTGTFCGTPEFMAPEIILDQRYGRAVDWWAFGVLIYEMLLGQSPFRGDDEDEIFDAILEDEPLYPIHMPRDSVSILLKLLTRDPARRLGGGPEDGAEVRRHTFFKDVNWDDVYHKRIPPPFFPKIGSATDTSNFDSEFTNTLSAADQKEFASFSCMSLALMLNACQLHATRQSSVAQPCYYTPGTLRDDRQQDRDAASTAQQSGHQFDDGGRTEALQAGPNTHVERGSRREPAQERKYFDSGDYALSKAGKAPHAAVGTAIPSPEDIPHANNPTSPVPAAHGNGGLSVSPNTAVSSPQKNYPGGGMAMSPPKFQGAGFGSSAFSPTNGSSLSGEPTRPEQPGTALPPRSVEQSMSERATSVSKPASARPEPTDMAFPMEE
ncbi:uncharacterized protein L969DRAFT_97980 [Mixia osmundae IAM 14324]|uniref:uncharacterized protein n=1 Tax=Mixia osmundae (strain CBS 9802 / IAM 14324 / JCM 22182 / KY 12970) TaxID=764103 RepID=UPI0004A54C80|nr:uncharacterized protein L969DRAFT_97980 [Mixia osmundae IAM 14324]KEI42706.1 hypothetical protein L969DRAFT_97980 [Mixia osmundae IAM 14324]